MGEFVYSQKSVTCYRFFSNCTFNNFQKDLIVFFLTKDKQKLFDLVNHFKLFHKFAHAQKLEQIIFRSSFLHSHGLLWSKSLRSHSKLMTWGNLTPLKRIWNLFYLFLLIELFFKISCNFYTPSSTGEGHWRDILYRIYIWK